MNKKDIASLRRRFSLEKHNITALRGCFVSARKEIVSCFDLSLPLMPEEEADRYLAILRRVFSGSIGRNLADIGFSTADLSDGKEYAVLKKLRESGLRDDDALKEFYTEVAASVELDSDYLILTAHDAWDLPQKGKDGGAQEDSVTVFRYVVCAVCPVKETRPALAFDALENTFRLGLPQRAASAPEIGFAFPAFEERSANLYGALYYTRDPAANHPEFIDSVFHTEAPVTAAETGAAFRTALTEAAGDGVSYDVLQGMREQLGEVMEDYAKNKSETAPLTVGKSDLTALLASSGMEEERVNAFGAAFDEAFGSNAQVQPENLVDVKKLELKTPDVVVRVNPSRGDLVETRVIDGVKYILIRADESVELDGVGLTIG